MKIYPQKPNQSGFAPIFIIVLIAIIVSSSILVIKNIPFKQSNSIPKIEESTHSAVAKTNPNSLISPTPKPTRAALPTPKASAQTAISSPTSTPAPQVKTITVSGFAYEDRTNDGIFNSDDIKLPIRDLYWFDTADGQKLGFQTDSSGNFYLTQTVKGNLGLQGFTENNFTPRDGAQIFTKSTDNITIAFRSASAPTANNNGIIEGDVIIEKERPYKFYLLDKDDNYYNGDSTGGHFKYPNLPNNKTYIIRISYGEGSPQDTEIILTPSNPEQKTIQIRIK